MFGITAPTRNILQSDFAAVDGLSVEKFEGIY